MSESLDLGPAELTDAELDAVSGGQPVIAGGLVNINGVPINVAILDNNQVSLTNVLNNNRVQVGVGAAAAILSGAAVGLVRQLTA